MKRFYLIAAAAFILLFAIGCAKDEVKPEELSSGKADTAREISGTQKNIPDIKSNSTKKADEDSKNNKETGTKNTEKNPDNENKNTNEETVTNSSDGSDSSSSSNGSKKAESDENSKPSTSHQTDENTSGETHESKKESSESNQTEQTEQDNPKEKPPAPPKKTVTVSIRTGDVKGTVLSPTKVPVSKGDTVLDATLKIVKKKGIQISVRGSNASAYVEGIDNLYEFDEGQMSGWHVRLDGSLIDKSAGVVTVQPGQTITWQYTTNYLEDSGRQG